MAKPTQQTPVSPTTAATTATTAPAGAEPETQASKDELNFNGITLQAAKLMDKLGKLHRKAVKAEHPAAPILEKGFNASKVLVHSLSGLNNG